MAQIHALTPEGRLPSAAVAHAAEIADDALGTIPERTAPIQKGADDSFSITDQDGRAALAVTPEGTVMVGATEHREDVAGYRVMDQDGRIAFEVTADGRTHAYDLATGGVPTADTTVLHLFVAAGQSNMSGRGKPIEGPQSPRIMQFGANSRVIEQAPLILDMVDTPTGTSPALFFARDYLATQPAHVGVLLVPAARGATGFSGTPENPASAWTWTKGAAPSPEYALYERSVEQALDAIAAAEAEGYHVIVKGVLWHQGEGNGGTSAERYGNMLDALIADYRADLSHPTLPFMVGQMCPEGIDINPNKVAVDQAHQDTPYRTPFTGFAPATRDGHNPGDTTHFSTVGTAHLGDTYNTAYIQALGNTSR